MTDLSELRAIAEAATPGPWVYDNSGPLFVYADDATGQLLARCGGPGFEHVFRPRSEEMANARYIAAFGPDVGKLLLAVAEAARQQVDRHPCDTIDTLHDALAVLEAALKETR